MALPDLESLACVDALARTLHFAKAARSRALSSPAFGRRIQQAEEQLGMALFERSTRRVSVAANAEGTLMRIRELLSQADALGQPNKARAVDVTMGTRHELGMSWLMPARGFLHRAMPGLTTHMFFGNTIEIEAAVSSLRIDAAVTSRLPATQQLEAIALHEEEYVFVGSAKAARGRSASAPSAIEERTLIDADESLPLAGYLFRAAGALRFRSVVLLGTIDAIRAAVVDGEGVAVLPRYFVNEHLRRGILVRLLPRLRLERDFFRWVFRRDSAKRALLLQMGEVLASRPLR